MCQVTRLAVEFRARRGGFTIVELLISIAVIAILLSVALVALATASRSASRLTTLNALRQMMVGYTGYTTEHNGQLLPGYVRPDMIGTLPGQLDLKAYLPHGTKLNAKDTASYVWRLAPYLDNAWNTYMSDYANSSLAEQFEQEYLNKVYGIGTYDGETELGIGMATSFGLNSVFVGGDSFHGFISNFHPWRNLPESPPWTTAAVHMREIKRPATLMVFGTSKRAHPEHEPPMATHPNTSVELGYIQLTAWWGCDLTGDCVCSWWINQSGPEIGEIHIDFNHAGGLPFDRTDRDMVPIALMDGSVRPETLLTLARTLDVWSPFIMDVPTPP